MSAAANVILSLSDAVRIGIDFLPSSVFDSAHLEVQPQVDRFPTDRSLGGRG